MGRKEAAHQSDEEEAWIIYIHVSRPTCCYCLCPVNLIYLICRIQHDLKPATSVPSLLNNVVQKRSGSNPKPPAMAESEHSTYQEPTMQLKSKVFHNIFHSNNSLNNNVQSDEEMSIVDKLFDVCQELSMCRQDVKSADVQELSQCPPLFQMILSDLSEMVAFTQEQQLQPSAYTAPINSEDDVSSLSSSLASIELPVGDLFVSNLSSFVDKVAPNSIFDKKRAKRYRKKKLLQMVPKMLRPIWEHCDEIFCQSAVPGPRPGQ